MIYPFIPQAIPQLKNKMLKHIMNIIIDRENMIYGALYIVYLLTSEEAYLLREEEINYIERPFYEQIRLIGWFIVFNATFNNISVTSVLLVEKTWVPGLEDRYYMYIEISFIEPIRTIKVVVSMISFEDNYVSKSFYDRLL